jgi:hypothetical protein
MFAYWDEQVRPKIAQVRGVNLNDVQVDALGDLRLLRNSIVHNSGVIKAGDYLKLKTMADLCRADTPISPTHDEMHRIFVAVKQAIGALILHYTGHLPGAPSASEIVDIAIQNVGSRSGRP